LIPVEVLTARGDEEGAGSHAARVGCEGGNVGVGVPGLGADVRERSEEG